MEPNIAIELSRNDGRYFAKVHFNLLKSSQSIGPIRSIKAFCEEIKATVDSTFEQVSALPGQSSAALIRFQPHSVSYDNDPFSPIDNTDLSTITAAVSELMKEWGERRNGFLK